MSKHFTKPFNPIPWHGSPHDFTGDNNLGIYTSETTQRYVYGTRYLMWDGAVYKYSKSAGVCYTGQLNMFQAVIGTVGIDYVVLPNDSTIGDRSVVLTAAVAQAEDTLAGGWIEFKTANTDAAGNQTGMQRRITGNTSCGAGGTTTVSFEGGLSAALTNAVGYAFCMPNPYQYVSYDAEIGNSSCGIAATYIAATGYNHWQQTWGLCLVTDVAATLGTVGHQRQLVAHNNGGVGPHLYGTATATAQQHVGFIVDDNTGANGMTMIMLQIDC